MQKHGGGTLFSASDLVNFMGCMHATMLDLGRLDTPVEVAYYRNGGILHTVLRDFLGGKA